MKSFILSILVLTILVMSSCNNSTDEKAGNTSAAKVDSSLTLPEGFTATIFADSLKGPRHITFSNGDLFVKMQNLDNGRGILRLRDTNGDGMADSIWGFGSYVGTGIAVKDGYL